MRRIAIVAVLVMLLVSSGTVFAFQNEPDGFRGLKWGDPPTEEMEFMRNLDEMLAVYRNPDEDNNLGDARFYMILHSFYISPGESVKRYMGAALYFRSKDNFDILETICKVKFGDPTEKGYLELGWMSLVTTIFLGYDSIEETGYLSLGSTPIFQEYTEEKEKKQAEEAEEDWGPEAQGLLRETNRHIHNVAEILEQAKVEEPKKFLRGILKDLKGIQGLLT